MIVELDETLDEEVFVIDVHDGPLWFAIEGDFTMDIKDWSVTWCDVKESTWFETMFAPDNGLLDFQLPLGGFDPRFVEDLLTAPVTAWKWNHYVAVG